ncbi:class I SAM-dependent methyltransferase [Ruminococcaceae bacterium OttesenSCG-928-I18]|nr:class I SAM-dependent methyltransferase [Ruminococcaceae bacterium OttesenSCG-928-I18]
MLSELLPALDPPEVFSQSPSPLWDDEHISAQMLLAHLDPEYEGASRKPEFIDASVGFISDCLPCARYPTLWDFGCGPGLYAERLAKLGYGVVGLDVSRRSIEYAKKAAEREGLPIEYRRQNYLEMSNAESCDAALLIYCDYGALSSDNRRRLLGNIYRALKPKGRLLLDVFSTAKFDAFEEAKVWTAFPKGGFWSEKPHLALQANRKYPKRVTLEQTVLWEEDTLRCFYIWNQYFTAEALAQEAQRAGFRVVSLYGDVAGAPLREEGGTLAALLEKGEPVS